MENTNVEENMKLVGYIINRHIKLFPKDDIQDLYQVGYVGLIKANKTFNLNKGVKWATYACKCILNEILMYKRKENKHKDILSLDSPTGESDKEDKLTTLEEILIDKNNIIEDRIAYNIAIKALNTEYRKKKFSDKTKKIIWMYIFQDYTQDELAKKFGVSQAFISRKINSFKNKLKEIMEIF